MTCDSVSKLIPLYYYSELSPEEEDCLDQHLPECPACAAEMERHRAMAAALERRRVEVPPDLLEDCRADLMAAISAGDAPAASNKIAKGPWTLFLEALNFSVHGFGRIRQPLAAGLLLLVGFGLAKLSTNILPGSSNVASLGADNVFSNVRSIQPDADGRVHIVVDQTTRREFTGNIDDAGIRKFLVAGSRDENAAVRMESVSLMEKQVGLMEKQADSSQVVDSLLNALENDPVDGVRLKALTAISPLATDPRVAKTLSQVLMTDANDGIRMKVIDIMMAHRNDMVVGALQNLMQSEADNDLRLKASKALQNWHASTGTF